MAVPATPAGVDLAAFVAELPGTWQGGGYRARCPAHADREPSLMVSQGRDGGIVLKCHAGCETKDVLAAMGKTFADISPAPRIVATYNYTHPDTGSLLWTVARYEPKDFRCRPGLPPPEQRVLYAAPWIHHARQTGQPIYVVEGEKDADNLLALGHPATCNVGGAGSGKWLPQYNTQLAGCHVRVIADNDTPGYKHAVQIATELGGHAASIEVFRPAAGCKDISDHLAAGHRLEALLPLEPPATLFGVVTSDLERRVMEWAWHHYFPIGALTLLEGDPGCGKSVLTIDLVARWSSGMPMPDGSPNPFGGPVNVLMISVEDDPQATILPRLMAAGARLNRVKLILGGRTETDVFNLSTDLDALAGEIEAFEARIVVIDPLSAFLSDGTDSNSDHSVRRTLGPLSSMLQHKNAAGLAVRHLNKGGGSNKALYRGSGSIGFVAASRAAYLVSRNPDDDEQRVLAMVKNNLAPSVPSLAYRLVTDATQDVPRLVWEGQLAAGAQDLVDGGGSDRGDTSQRTDVQDFLRHVCAVEPLKWSDIVKYGRDAGFSATALEKHRGKVLVKQFLSGAGNRGVTWGLRNSSPPAARPLHLVPTPVEEEEETNEDIKDRLLNEAPLVCDTCGDASELALKFFKPHWVIRCKAHNPMTYRV